MRRIVIVIILINIIFSAYSKKVSQRSYKNAKGQIIEVEYFKDESDDLYKVETTYENNEKKQSIFYYHNDPEYKEKSTVIFEKGKPKTIYTIHKENNPFYWISSVAVYNKDGIIITTQFKDNPDKKKELKQYYNEDNEKIKSELIFNINNGRVKEIDYYNISGLVKVEFFYKNDPEGLESIITYYDEYNKEKLEEQYYDSNKQPKALRKLVAYYENGIKVREEQFFDKPLEDVAYKLEIFYENGKMVKITAYDKDGNIIPD